MSKKILIVDDEENVHKILKRILSAPSCEIMTAFNGEEALELAINAKPDLILLDINMPKMNGNEVMQRLRQNARTCAIPVIMLTGNVEVVDRVVGYELGVQDYVTKPFEVRDLKSRISSFVGYDS